MKIQIHRHSSFAAYGKVVALIFALLFVQPANAQLDPTFGTGGVTVTNVAGDDRAIETFVLPFGKILVLNSATAAGQTTFQLLRYNADGTLDATYGSGGVAALVFPSLPNHVFTKAARQPDGKIVLSGGSNNDSLVVRINEDATLDASFAGGGIHRPNFNPNGADKIEGLVIQPDGKILVASYFYLFSYNLSLVRYLPNGTLDAAFGSGGVINHVISAAPGSSIIAEDIYLQSNGKILIKGHDVRRFNPDGSADSSFSVTSISSTYDPMRTQMVVQPDDKFLVATRVYKTASLERAEYDVRVTRYNQNGGLDNSFGIGGQTDIDVTSVFRDQPVALTVQPDNQILVGITTFIPVNRSRARGWTLSLARLSPIGAVNGKFLVTKAYPNYDAFVRILPDGKILTVYGIYDANNSTDLLLTRSMGVPAPAYRFRGIPFDFVYDSNGVAEYSVFRPTDQKWYFDRSIGNGYTFGAAGDVLVPSDYIKSFGTEMAVFRPSNGTWYIAREFFNAAQNFISVQWGQAGDIPVPADYDGDGKSDIAVFRPSNGVWYIRRSADNSLVSYQFGASEDKPVAGDYDGDGLADIAVWRPSSGIWYIRNNSGGLTGIQFGAGDADVPVQEDYDGDGVTDISVRRIATGVWYRINSSDQSFSAMQWGAATDAAVPADYDGDSKIDIAVWRPGNAGWYVFRSSTAAPQVVFWGQTNDLPIPKRQ